MFERPVANPAQTFINNGNLNPPGFEESLGTGVLSSLFSVPAAVQDVGHALSKTPGEGWAQQTLDYINNQQSVSGSSTGGFISGNVLGALIAPENIAAGAAVKGAAKGVQLLAETQAPKVAIGAAKVLEGGAIGGATAVPYSIPSNYKANDGSIDWAGTAEGAAPFAGLGLALPLAPFLYGVVKGKINASKIANATDDISKVNTTSAPTQEELDAAKANGTITPDEHQFMSSFVNGQAPDINNVKSVADAHGVQYDPSLHTNIPLATPDDINNIHTTGAQELASATPETPPEQVAPMTNHILNSRINEITPQQIDGMNGFAEHMDTALANKENYLDAVDKDIENHPNIDNTHPLSQESLYAAAKNQDIPPYKLPPEVSDALKHDDKIADAKNLIATRESQLQREGLTDEIISKRTDRLKNAQSSLEDLEASRPKLLSPDEELNSLKDTLLNPSTKMVEKINARDRLNELSSVSEKAEAVRNRIDLEENYNKQKALSTVAKAAALKAQQGVDLASSQKNIVDYLRNRVMDKVKPLTKETAEIPKFEQGNFDDLSNAAKDEATQDIIQMGKEKAEEIDKESSFLKNMMSCIIGA